MLRIVWLLLTLAPFLYLIYITSFASEQLTSGPDHFEKAFIRHNLLTVYMLWLIGSYMVHLFNTNSLQTNKKIIWALALLAGNVFVMPFYWFHHVWNRKQDS